jgi:class 3 adenylate cyclase
MNLLANSPPVPLRQRNPEIPEPVAQVIDRALREQEIPHDTAQMHTMLESLRYHDAGVFRDALAQALKEVGITGALTNVWKAPLQKPQTERHENTSADAIMYSIIQPTVRKDVALFLLDFVGSTQYILDKGDTDFSTLIGTTLRRVKKHSSASELTFLKSTGDGFLAVYPTVPPAISLALAFLEQPVHPDVHIRMALHWGPVNTGPDGDVLGTEVRRVFRIEKVSPEEQIEPAMVGESFPSDNRIVITRPVFEHLDASVRAMFRFAGKFQISQREGTCCELWVLSKT